MSGLVKFTRPDGKAVYIRADDVEEVRDPLDGDHPKARAVLVMVSGFQAVRETPEQAAEMLK